MTARTWCIWNGHEENWSNGVLEYWAEARASLLPTLHHSITPFPRSITPLLPSPMNPSNRKHLLDIESLSADEITLVHETARAFKAVGERAIKKVPALRGKTVVNLFIEPSTRTQISFELAAMRLSADVINFTAEASSLKKGETLRDTARNLEALNTDIIVIRHSATGAPHFLSRVVNAHIVNAGDGAHEHPTQALLDAFTIREKKGRIEGLNVTILGDILYSRVARSNIWALTKLGAKVTLCGPATLVPRSFEQMGC